MIIKSIPLSTLIHTVTYEAPKPPSRYGGGYEQPITIEKVLLQHSSQIKKRSVTSSSQGVTEEYVTKGILFIDRTHSRPFILLKEQARITLDSVNYIVDTVETLYDNMGVHHYEVSLV